MTTHRQVAIQRAAAYRQIFILKSRDSLLRNDANNRFLLGGDASAAALGVCNDRINRIGFRQLVGVVVMELLDGSNDVRTTA